MESPSDRVAVHSACVGPGLEDSGRVSPSGARRAERPVGCHAHGVAAPLQLANDRAPEPGFDADQSRLVIAWIERAREVARMEARRIDRGLETEPEDSVREK